MSDEESGEIGWLQGPPEANQIRFYLDVGDNVDITEEQKDALDVFLNSLMEEEVAGHAIMTECTKFTTCSPKSLCETKPICSPRSCNIIYG